MALGPPCAVPLKAAALSPDGPLTLWHNGLELLRAAHWCFASLRISPFPPAGLRAREGPQGKGWFHKEPDPIRNALPFQGRGPRKEQRK
jgi:hypothetical protein